MTRLDPAEALRGEQVLAVERMRVPPQDHLVRDARRFVLEHAPELTPDTRHTLELLTSELVTNAVIHARTEVEVVLAIGTRHVLVAVHDLDPPVRQAEAAGDREGGWGLGLVNDMAVRSETVRHPGGGKTAWFTLPRDDDGPVP